jgi:hypothetical protein
MKLKINKQSTIGEIQDSFNNQFEFLKLGFFVDRNNDGKLSADEEMKHRNIILGSFKEFKNEGEIEITDSTSVVDLENLFNERFGLDVQVFRKSSNLWLITTKTDNWTIDQQNKQAKEMSNPVAAPEPTDYQEHD